MADNPNTHSIRGERALREGDVDRLGFKDVAQRIAGSLVDHASDDGFVIGIDGPWGSGKSSLLHLISTELDLLPDEKRPTVISFQPWLVGNRDALLASLFNQLVTAIAKFQHENGDATKETWRQAKKAITVARSFGKSISNAGEVIKNVPLGSRVAVAGSIIQAIGNFISGESKADLPKQKQALAKAFRQLGHRFIITVDDIDRLEPSEVIEVLRLVRSVADFPNIIYLLCYDSAILAESVKRGANVPDGAAFLEKIVQLTVMVPKPEPFQLRQWFGDEIGQIVGSISDGDLRRLRSVIDFEGGTRLKTPRAVVRSLDSFRFFWPALRSESVDIPDLVWLLLIKDGSPALYRWIESYLAGASVISTGMGTVQDAAKANDLRQLIEVAGEGHFDELMYRHAFAEQLPGVEIDYAKETVGIKLYQGVSDAERDSAIAGRRLASPDHYRLYFALTGPGHTITHHQAYELWEAASKGVNETAYALLALGEQRISAELTKVDLFLERLGGALAAEVKPERAENLLLALSNIMDAFDKPNSDQSFMIFTTWDRAERVVARLLGRAGSEKRSELIDRIFRDGAALGWLSSLLRRETFAHGRYGDQSKPSDQWILTDEEYDRAAAYLVARYRALSLHDILSKTRPLNLLFAWSQGGDTDGPKNLLEEATLNDDDFAQTLNAFISTVNSSDQGIYEVIQAENVRNFIDYDAAVARIKNMSAEGLTTVGAQSLERVRAALKNQRIRYGFNGSDDD